MAVEPEPTQVPPRLVQLLLPQLPVLQVVAPPPVQRLFSQSLLKPHWTPPGSKHAPPTHNAEAIAQ